MKHLHLHVNNTLEMRMDTAVLWTYLSEQDEKTSRQVSKFVLRSQKYSTTMSKGIKINLVQKVIRNAPEGLKV